MGKIKLSEGTYSVIPEGTYVFKIVSVTYKEDFGKMEILMETKDGQKHTERFSLLKSNGDTNDGALNAFSYFAKTALNDYSLKEINCEDLVGHFIECDVEHDVQPGKNDPSKTVTFARLTGKYVSEGWEEVKTVSASAPAVKTESGKPKYDLKALLG